MSGCTSSPQLLWLIVCPENVMSQLTLGLLAGRILRHALDKIAEIKSLLEERRIGREETLANVCTSRLIFLSLILMFCVVFAAAKMAGVYSDSDPPRKTMRRGVLMTLLQQSAMTLPLWIGKPGER